MVTDSPDYETSPLRIAGLLVKCYSDRAVFVSRVHVADRPVPSA
jgi:hypothetical protein